MPVITAAYAALLGLILLALSIRVIQLRARHRVSLGDGGHVDLQRAIRGQGNFVEYAPIALVLLLCLELVGGPAWLVHGCGLALVAGRAAHGTCFGFLESSVALRRGGMVLTFAAIGAAALGDLWLVVAR